MNVSESRHPASPATDPHATTHHMRLHEIEPQLREMLADEDWLPACKDVAGLQALLLRIENDPAANEDTAPPDVALLVAAHQDFSRFRRALAARLNSPDDKPLHITPDEWLYLRLRHPEKAANLAPYAQYRPEDGRFHIVD
jgi:hypothetical protein